MAPCVRPSQPDRRSGWCGSGAVPMSRWRARSMPRNRSPWVRPCGGRWMAPRNSSPACSAPAPRGSEMAEAVIKRVPGRGRFISFEGGEGSGKSTQIKKLAERLDAAKLRAIVTREPGGSPGAEIIRHLVLSGMGKLLGPEAETLLFAAARDDHVRTVIQPALSHGLWVLCDRFSDSTRAYQGRLGQVAPGVLNAMQRVTIG